MAKVRKWLKKLHYQPTLETKSIDALEHPTCAVVQFDEVCGQHLEAYDENLLERSCSQWQFGDWASLIRLEREALQQHPDRAKLALLAAAGHLQNGDVQAARQFTRLAQDWGCSKTLISQILISGVYNNLGRASLLSGQATRAKHHFNQAISTGSPDCSVKLITQARVRHQSELLGMPLLCDGEAVDTGMAKARATLGSKGYSQVKPLIRTIHHLSCTGGTLFAKCLAAQPNVVLLNEIDPFSKLALDASNKPQFSPRDIISLLHQSGHEFDDAAIAEVFLNDIRTIHDRLANSNKALVLREHTHGAYLLGSSVRGKQKLTEILDSSFERRSVVTVRNPIDSYLSLKEFGWVHFQPATFNEYCERYLGFLDDYSGVKLFRYEDFVENSLKVMPQICNHLELEYMSAFAEHFFQIKLSGDSGRSGATIALRERRFFNQDFAEEANKSKSFIELSNRLGYSLTI